MHFEKYIELFANRSEQRNKFSSFSSQFWLGLIVLVGVTLYVLVWKTCFGMRSRWRAQTTQTSSIVQCASTSTSTSTTRLTPFIGLMCFDWNNIWALAHEFSRRLLPKPAPSRRSTLVWRCQKGVYFFGVCVSAIYNLFNFLDVFFYLRLCTPLFCAVIR